MANAPSANDTAVFVNGGTITDASGNVWTLTNGQVAVNGQVDPTTANVIEMAYVNGEVWQENGNYLWSGKTSSSANWSPAGGATASPLPASPAAVSANNTVATQVGQTITDATHDTWSIGDNGQVLIDGAADPTTANVVALAYENGQVWREDASGLWWAKSSPSASWSPAQGTPTSPVPAGSTPTAAPQDVLTWVGGGDNSAADPANWSPAMSPAPGDTLMVTQSATVNVAGDALAGNTLTVATNSPSSPVAVTTSDSAALSLQANFSPVALTALDPTTVTIGAIHGSLTSQGAPLQFIGNSSLNGVATFNNDLTGSGRIALTGAQGEGTQVAVNGAVGSGLTFGLLAVAPVLTLDLNDPAAFAGTLNIPDMGSFGSVVFGQVQATSGTLQNGVLNLYNGSTPVDSTRVTGNLANLTLDQTSSGVALSQNHLFSGNTGATPLPLAFSS